MKYPGHLFQQLTRELFVHDSLGSQDYPWKMLLEPEQSSKIYPDMHMRGESVCDNLGSRY